MTNSKANDEMIKADYLNSIKVLKKLQRLTDDSIAISFLANDISALKNYVKDITKRINGDKKQ